eukprot:6015622-Pleurochrysis_carterae.AAC.1
MRLRRLQAHARTLTYMQYNACARAIWREFTLSTSLATSLLSKAQSMLGVARRLAVARRDVT